MDFDEATDYLHGLTRLGIKLGNERFEALLERLGNPQNQFQAVHIAGTKGKGSTSVFASSILRSAGYRTGTYLSPFVYDLRERIQIDGEMITRDAFARLASRIRPISEELAQARPDFGPATEFEFKTAIGFCYFAEEAVDLAVIEVGLGGRLDATNVLPNPLVSVITNIGYDHMNLLGDTLTQIAGEKAGIVRPNGVCVTGAQSNEALEKIASVCAEKNARLVRIANGRGWGSEYYGRGASARGSRLWVETPRRTLHGLELGMRGEFQQANAALAVHALDNARTPLAIDDEDVQRGLAVARVPGRLEIVRGEAPAVVVDAAHNAMAAEALSDALRAEFFAAARPLIMVVGMSKGHEPLDFLRALLAHLDLDRVTLIATEPSFHPREAPELARVARELGVSRTEVVLPVRDAATRALDTALSSVGTDADPLVLVTGSFFTIGDLPPERWQEIFEQRGLNETIPVDIIDIKEQIPL